MSTPTQADQARAFVPMDYTVLGTDGFGRSDTRANLRRHFEVDRHYIAHAAICALAKAGKMTAKDVTRAIKQYKIDTDKPNPVDVLGFTSSPRKRGPMDVRFRARTRHATQAPRHP